MNGKGLSSNIYLARPGHAEDNDDDDCAVLAHHSTVWTSDRKPICENRIQHRTPTASPNGKDFGSGDLSPAHTQQSPHNELVRHYESDWESYVCRLCANKMRCCVTIRMKDYIVLDWEIFNSVYESVYKGKFGDWRLLKPL